MRRRVIAFRLLSSFVVLCASAAQADHAPAYVVPGRSDVPVMINGYDASWGVVSGDWGLYRPGAGRIEVYPSPYVPPPYQRPVPRYFPSLGAAPGIGRYEINPPAHRPMPPRAQSFHQTWGAQSDMGPVTDYAPTGPMFIAPTVEDFGRRRTLRSNPRPQHRH